MSNNIETNVVSMQFDNTKFNSNVEKSSTAISNFASAITKAEGIATKAGFHISDVFQKVSSALEQNFAVKIINTIDKLTTSLSTDQISAGWSKFEKKTQSVQTIMSATGKTVDEVNGTLDNLMWFADETSYSFSDMTDNIGKFTAAGIKLDTAQTAMQGIALWAAKSGQGAAEASRAMYNMSQAMGVGYMSQMDWKSIENANMATKEFKEEVMKTAEALGTIKKVGTDDKGRSLFQAIVEGETAGNAFTVESMRSELAQKWMTDEVMLKTLDRYGAFSIKLKELSDDTDMSATSLLQAIKKFKSSPDSDLSKWAEEAGMSTEEFTDRIKEMSGGVYELGYNSFLMGQQAKTWTETVDATADAVSSAWMRIYEAIFGNYEEAAVFYTKLVEDFWTIFAEPVDTIGTLLEKWKELGGRDVLFKSFENVEETFMTFIETIREAFSEIFPSSGPEGLMSFTRKIESVTGKIKDFLLDNMDRIKRTAKGIFAVFDIGFTIIKSIYRIVKPLFDVVAKSLGFTAGLTANIGDGLVYISERLKNSKKLENFITWTTAKIQTLANWFGKFIDLLKEAKGPISSFASKVSNLFGDLFGKGLDTIQGPTNSLITFFKDIVEWCKKAGQAISDFVHSSTFIDTLSKIWDKTKLILDKILNLFKIVFNKIHEYFTNFTISKGLKDLTAGGIFALLLQLRKNLKSAEDFGGMAKKFVKSIQGVFEAISKGLNDIFASEANKRNAQALKETAIAIAILAGSILVLSTIDDDSMSRAIVGISAILGVMAALFGMIKTMSMSMTKMSVTFKGIKRESASFNKVGVLMIELSVAILIMANAMKVIGAGMSEDEMKRGAKGIAIITGVIGGLIVVIGLLSRFGNKSSKINITFKKKSMNIVGALLALAVVLGVMALVIKTIGSMKTDQALQGGVALIGMVIMLGVLCKALDGVKIPLRTAVSLTMIAPVLMIMVGIIALLGLMDPDKAKHGIIALAAICVGLAYIAKSLDRVKIKYKTAISLTMMVSVLMIMAGIVALLGLMDPDKAKQGIKALAAICLGISGMASVLSKSPISPKTGASILMMVPVMAAMAIIVAAIGAMDFKNAVQGLAALAIIGGGIVGLAFALNNVNISPKTALSILAISGALLVLSGVVAIIGNMGFTDAATGVLAVVTLLAAIAGVAILITKTKAGEGLQKFGLGLLFTAAGIAAFGVALAAIGGGLALLALGIVTFVKLMNSLSDEVGKFGKTFGRMVAQIFKGLIIALPDIFKFISLLLAEVIKLIVQILVKEVPTLAKGFLEFIIESLDLLIKYMPIIMEKLFTIIHLALRKIIEHLPEFIGDIVDFVAGIFNAFAEAFKNVDMDKMLEGMKMVGLFTLMEAELAACLLLLPLAVAGAVGLLSLFGILKAIFIAIGFMSQDVENAKYIYMAGDMLQAIGTAIGQFIGGLIGGIAEGVTNVLPNIASDLSAFMEKLGPFINGISAMQDLNYDKFKGLIGCILLLTGAELLDGLAKFLSGGTTSYAIMGAELSAFAIALIPFLALSPLFNNVDFGNLEHLAKFILIMTANDLLSGITSWFSSDVSWVDFAKQLSAMAPELVNFSKLMTGYKADVVDAAIPSISKIVELESKLANHGGLASLFAGDNDFSKFGPSLVHLANGAKSFCDTISTIKSFDNVDQAVEVIGQLIEMEDNLTGHDGLWDALAGDNDFSRFGPSLTDLANGAKAFCDTISTIKSFDNVEQAISTLDKLVGMEDNLTGHDGFWDSLAGDNDFSKFGTSLTDLATGIVNFVTSVSGDGVKFELVDKALKFLTDVIGLEDQTDGVEDVFTDFGDGLSNFAESIENVDLVRVSEAITTINNMAAVMNSSSTQSIKDFVNAFMNIGKVSAENVVSGLSSGTMTAVTYLNSWITGLANVVTSSENIGKITTSVKTLIKKSLLAIKSMNNNFRIVGSQAVSGFCNGITTNLSKAYSAGSKLGKAALDAAKRSLDEHSPSKKFKEIGIFAGEGLVIGLNGTKDKVYSSAYNVGETAKNAVTSAISNAYNLISEGIDAEPTIRPVMDLSNVENGMGAINGMFDNVNSMTVRSGNISKLMSARSANQNEQANKINKLYSALSTNKPDEAITIQNTFNITGDNPKDIANEISKIIDQQTRRRDMAWGI